MEELWNTVGIILNGGLALRGATQLSSVKIVNAPECGKVAARQ
ncbi:hypothetical protein ACFGUO_000283 [Salmonella enterica]|nr:hypothetical protein [Salmonella enterica]ESH45332.1 hypothetical protein SEEB8392_17281 [Salmonella enterica subsp. enterica serovar Berta str. ATCC 8392]